jgi:hypothetical protein
MKKVSVLVSIGVVFAVLGCSRDSQKLAVVPTPVAAASTSPVRAIAAALPVPSVEKVNDHVWRSDNIQDHLGDAIGSGRLHIICHLRRQVDSRVPVNDPEEWFLDRKPSCDPHLHHNHGATNAPLPHA